MSSWRIRDIEKEIRQLERKLLTCSEKEKYNIRRKIDDLKSELRKLKKREEEEDEKDEFLSSIIGIGIGSSSWSGGGFHFGGGSSGGGVFGGGW